MDTLLEKLWRQVARDRTATLESRLFRLLTLAAAVISLGVALPCNLLEPDMPWVVNAAVSLAGLLSLFCYFAAVRGREYKAFFILMLVALVDVVWLRNGGVTGSNTYYFLSLMAYPVAIWRQRRRWWFAGIIWVNIVALFAVDYYFPQWIFHFGSRAETYFDDLNGCLASTAAVVLVMWAVATSYDREQDRLSRVVRELAMSEANHRMVVENAACIIVRLDPDGHIIFLNRQAERVFGYAREELIGRSVLGTILPEVSSHGEDQRGFFDAWRADPSLFPAHQNENICRDGRRIWVSWGNVLTYDEQGVLREVLCVGTDLTEVRAAQERRLQNEQHMQHVQRLESLGLLAGGIAHDFNNLLTSILGNVQLVKLDTPAGSPSAASLESAERACRQARDLTGQLLTFAKGGKPVKKLLDLHQVVREACGLALRGKPCQCDVLLGEPLLAVEADPGQMAQVFNNLLLNASQAMSGAGRITVRARNCQVTEQAGPRALPPGDYVEVTVQDTGHGIAPEILPKIFDPYFTTKSTGNGLGLAVVHSVIQNHGGEITVRSSPGVGTEFTVRLPAVKAEVSATEFMIRTTSPTGNRILVMDDDESVRDVLTQLIARLGYQVTAVADGAAVVERYVEARRAGAPFHLVVLDLNVVGGMGGEETLRHLRALDPGVRAVVSSGYSDNAIMAEYLAHGFKGVVAKPYTINQLAEALRAGLAAA